MGRLKPLQRVIGFASSMALLAVASLVTIPIMMRVSGAVAWGAVALGQAVGGVASVLIGFGWNMAGPAKVAAAGFSSARLQLLDSIRARLVLFLPVTLLAISISVASAHGRFPELAAMGALSSSAVGLSTNWYFVGRMQPWVLLATETLPRVGGTLLGVVFMLMGRSALAGVFGQFLGMLFACVISSWWALRTLDRLGAEKLPGNPIRSVLLNQRDGVVASVSGAVFGSLPVVIVAWVNPAAQPLFAFVDKLQRQMQVALTPFVTVLQGWVPRGDRLDRSRRATSGGMALCLVISTFIFSISPLLSRLLGGGQIHTGWMLNLGMALYVGLGAYELILSHAVLSTLNRLTQVGRATLVTGIFSLVALIVCCLQWGAVGSVGAIVVGLAFRCVWEALVAINALRSARTLPRRALL